MNEQQLKLLGNKYMQEHGLIDLGWTFETMLSSSFYGDCDDNRKRIRVSSFIAKYEPYDKIVDTILHEIAHALVGCWQGHNKIWKAKAREIGAKPKSCHEYCKATTQAILAEKTKYVMCYGDKVVKAYSRKPNKKTIANIANYWATGKKKETYGKLAIEEFDASRHKEYI